MINLDNLPFLAAGAMLMLGVVTIVMDGDRLPPYADIAGVICVGVSFFVIVGAIRKGQCQEMTLQDYVEQIQNEE